jgi:hypothetical protein
MKRISGGYLVPFLLLGIILLGAAAGCSSSTTTTTSAVPGGGALVRNDSIVTVRIASIGLNDSGLTDLSVYLVSTQDVGDLVNPVKDKVGQTFDVWTDEDVAALKVGETVNGRIEMAGDAIIGITYHLYDIGK